MFPGGSEKNDFAEVMKKAAVGETMAATCRVVPAGRSREIVKQLLISGAFTICKHFAGPIFFLLTDN